jgi:hypothetical protein
MEKDREEHQCLNCGKPITRAKKKWCSVKCSYEYKYKNDEKYKEVLRERARNYYFKNRQVCDTKAKLYFKTRWLTKPENRKKFNEKMRTPNRLRWQRLYIEREEKKLCMRCGGPRDEEFKHCRACLDKMNKWN